MNMGEAAPAPAEAPGFSPVLNPDSGSGPVSAPRLHSAIVERLRARIELCRRHHSACESRYARGQAEITDREREATLQLLSMVQHGTGNRRTKERGTRGGTVHGPEGSRANGERKHPDSGEAKLSTRIALQGSLRRRIEGQPPGYTVKQNGHFCMGSASGFKRLRTENHPLHPDSCGGNEGQPQSIALGHTVRRKDSFLMTQGIESNLFNTTLRDMKKEPGEVQTCSNSSTNPAMMVFDFKDEAGGQIDPELQDLFDELTKSVPAFQVNELELEKMLKQDNDFDMDLGRPTSAGTTNPCLLLDKPIKTEYLPDFGQAPGSSPQLRPASAGPSFSMTNTASPIAPGSIIHNQLPQTSGASSRGLSVWPEMSHAEQLKQMAANQQPKQQSNSLLHHQQQSQAGGVRNWPSAMSGHPSSFCQNKIANTGSLSQPRISPQSTVQGKGMPNYLGKPSGYSPSNPPDMKTLSNKPMLHFTPKTSTSTTSQQIPHMGGSQNKPITHQQQSIGGQNMQFHLSMQSSCLQPKPLNQTLPLNQHASGMNFKMNQQIQGLAPGPRYSANGCLVAQQRSPVPNSQINSNKGQRQLSQAQHHTSDTEKFNPQDQFNRHLTRPPPDYKQPPIGGVQHPNLYSGLRSSINNNSSDQNDIQSLSCHMSNGQGVKIVSNSGDSMFHGRSDPHSGPLEVQNCPSHLHQQPNNQVQIGMHQKKPQFPGIAPTTQHTRTSTSQDALLGQGLAGMTTTANRETVMSWGNATKQLDVKRHPGAQTDTHFTPRPIGPPNQVVPHSGLISLNPGIRSTAPRASQPRIPPLPGISGINQSSPTSQGCLNTFGGTAQSPGAYQNNHAGRLTFDFLQDGDNTVPGINADSDFIDSLLKSGSTNDDWMKDINLEEILGGHS